MQFITFNDANGNLRALNAASIRELYIAAVGFSPSDSWSSLLASFGEASQVIVRGAPEELENTLNDVMRELAAGRSVYVHSDGSVSRVDEVCK